MHINGCNGFGYRFNCLGGCDPGTRRTFSVRRRSGGSERQYGPIRGAALDRASRGGLCVRPSPRLGPSWISSGVKVAHYHRSWPAGSRRFGDRWDPVDRGWGAGVIRLLPPVGGTSLAEVFARTLNSAPGAMCLPRKPRSPTPSATTTLDMM